MSLNAAKPQAEVAYQELCALVKKHAGHLTAAEMLAVASNLMGKLVAMQDQRTMTPAVAMEIVARNVEYGNQSVLAQLADAGGARN